MTDYTNEIAMLTAAKNSLCGAKYSLYAKDHKESSGYIAAIICLTEAAIRDLQEWSTQ